MLLKSRNPKNLAASTMVSSMMTSLWMTILKKFPKQTAITKINHLLSKPTKPMSTLMTSTSNLPKRQARYKQKN
jgi:hypothetical protein